MGEHIEHAKPLQLKKYSLLGDLDRFCRLPIIACYNNFIVQAIYILEYMTCYCLWDPIDFLVRKPFFSIVFFLLASASLSLVVGSRLLVMYFLCLESENIYNINYFMVTKNIKI
ncbi:hypothetical protein ACJX0J_032697, partial [Zea mays]